MDLSISGRKVVMTITDGKEQAKIPRKLPSRPGVSIRWETLLFQNQ